MYRKYHFTVNWILYIYMIYNYEFHIFAWINPWNRSFKNRSFFGIFFWSSFLGWSPEVHSSLHLDLVSSVSDVGLLEFLASLQQMAQVNSASLVLGRHQNDDSLCCRWFLDMFWAGKWCKLLAEMDAIMKPKIGFLGGIIPGLVSG